MNGRGAPQRNLSERELAPDGSTALDNGLSLETQHVQLHQPKSEQIALVFPDVGDLVWDSCEVTQLQPGEIGCTHRFGMISHELSGLLSGAFKGSKLVAFGG